MFYRLNNLTGRLVSSAQLKALLPQGLKAASEPTPIIYDSSFKLSPIPVQEMKTAGSSSRGGVVYGPLNPKFRAAQIKFQVENNVPVHLKGGPMDYALFGFTTILIAVGLFETFRFYYQMSFPKKPDEC